MKMSENLEKLGFNDVYNHFYFKTQYLLWMVSESELKVLKVMEDALADMIDQAKKMRRIWGELTGKAKNEKDQGTGTELFNGE